jgi:hypothetical protein
LGAAKFGGFQPFLASVPDASWNRWLKSWSAEHRAALPKPIRSEPIDARRSNRPCCGTKDKKREAFRLDGRRKKI